MQIISDKSVETVTLGQNANTFEDKRVVYNNAIITLNDVAEKYMNTTYATDVRCVGSIPTIKDGVFINKDLGTKTTVTLPPSEWTSYTRLGGWTSDDTGCYDIDTNYITDQIQMQKYGLEVIGGYYWLASRSIASTSGYSNFCIRSITDFGRIRWLWKSNYYVQ